VVAVDAAIAVHGEDATLSLSFARVHASSSFTLAPAAAAAAAVAARLLMR
jgi:hypothetical protein